MKTVGLFFGGTSHEHDVSLASALSFLKNIDYSLYKVKPFKIEKFGHWRTFEVVEVTIKNLEDLKEEHYASTPPLAALEKIDIAFPLIHGETGEDGKMQGFFEILGINYVGCGVQASAVGMNKVMTKEIAEKLGGASIVPYSMLRKSDWEKSRTITNNLPFPVFVKPVRAGSSIGVSKAYNQAELGLAIDKAFLVDEDVLLESYIKGREIEVGVIGKSEVEVSLPGEITFASDFYDYENKYSTDSTVMHIPALLSKEKQKTIMEDAKNIYKSLGCEGYSRIDFFLEDGTENIYFNEVNTSPGFTEKSMFPVLFSKLGYSFTDLLTRIIEEQIVSK